MVHVPVDNRRQAQLPDVGEFKAQWPAGELHLARHLNYGPECHAFQRYRMATPERVQVDAVAVIRANHGQAGKASPHSAASVCRIIGIWPLPLKFMGLPRQSCPDAKQRVEEPFQKRALLENDIRSQKHIGLERYAFAIGVNIRTVE